MPDLTITIDCEERQWRVLECNVLLLAKKCRAVVKKSSFEREGKELTKKVILTFPTVNAIDQFKVELFADVRFDNIVIGDL